MSAEPIDIISGGNGGIAGVLACHSFDTVKSRMQSQGTEHIPVRYKSSIDCFKQIVRTEGVRGLYKGVLYPVMMQYVINAIVFGVEGKTKRLLKDNGPWSETIIGTIAGMTAGFAQTVVCAPMELVKLRVQHQGIGEAKPHHKGNCATLKEAYRKGAVRGWYHGVMGCYQGFWITALRDTPGFGVYFATYETLMHFTVKKYNISKDDISYYGFASIWGGCAGMASWLPNYPVDVVKTQIQLDGAFDKERQHRSSWGCLKTIVKKDGVKGLFAGLYPCLLRGFANGAVLFVVVENTKRLLSREEN